MILSQIDTILVKQILFVSLKLFGEAFSAIPSHFAYFALACKHTSKTYLVNLICVV